MIRWSSSTVGSIDANYLQSLRLQSPVSVIATPRTAFSVRQSSAWSSIESEHVLDDFDQIPLTSRGGKRIEAVFIRGEGRIPLNTDMFMAADASLLSFVESADRQGFRFLLADGEVAGLVTLSDLQKLPVYALLFGLVIAVEMLLMECIRTTCGSEPDAWLDFLTPREQERLDGYWQGARKKNVSIDRLSCASFGQEVKAAVGLGIVKRGDRDHGKLKALQELRNQVCHALEIAPSPEAALKIPARARDALDLAGSLREVLSHGLAHAATQEQ